MTEEDARLALLQTELNAIQSGIRGMDTILFQIKGWCVTAALAIGGFAVTSHRVALLAVGVAAVLGFYLVNCQFKMIQRAFMDRNKKLDAELRTYGIMGVLKGAGSFDIVGTTPLEWKSMGSSFSTKIRDNIPALLEEARMPSSFSFYALILACLAAELLFLS